MDHQMTEPFAYMPLLQSRKGEFEALRNLDHQKRRLARPLVTITPPKWDFDSDQPICSLHEHVGKLALKFRNSWGPAHGIRVDGYLLDTPDSIADGTHPMERMMDIGNAYGIQMIPVIGLERSLAYRSLTKKWAAKRKRGATIRIEKEDLLDADQLTNGIKSLLDYLALSATNVDIVFDLKAITETEEAILADRVATALSALPFAREWRSAFIAATAFPENLGAIKRDSIGTIPRLEWEFWKSIDRQRRRFDRTPLYADYAVAHPAPVQIQNPRVSGNIRYTTHSSWTVLKGRLIKKEDDHQMRRLCQDLTARDEYCGRDFSAGDRHISLCAEGRVGPGSPSTWRFVGTSHHISFALQQLKVHFEKTRQA